LIVDGLDILSVDSNGDGTPLVPILDQKPRKEVTLQLPIPLLDSSTITISGFDNRTIDAGDFLLPSVGRYSLTASFDPSQVPDGANNANPSIDLTMTVGNEGYAGGNSLGAGEICVNGTRWSECNGG